MSIEKGKEIILDLSKNGIEDICFSGGENLLHFDEICELIACAKSLNIHTTIISNAYWAKTRELSIKKVKILSEYGLKRIAISTDQFHLQYVPLKNVINALDAAEAVGLPYEILLSKSKNDRVCNRLKKQLSPYTTHFREEYIAPFGRAKFLPEKFFLSIDTDMYATRCDAVTIPVITPSYTMMACCVAACISPTRGNPLVLGSLNRNSVSSLLQKANEDIFIKILRAWGPKGLAELYESAGYNITGYNQHPCELCIALLNINKKSLDQLRQKLDTPVLRRKLQCANFLIDYKQSKTANEVKLRA